MSIESVEVSLAKELNVQHSSLILSLLTKAYEKYKTQRSTYKRICGSMMREEWNEERITVSR